MMMVEKAIITNSDDDDIGCISDQENNHDDQVHGDHVRDHINDDGDAGPTTVVGQTVSSTGAKSGGCR